MKYDSNNSLKFNTLFLFTSVLTNVAFPAFITYFIIYFLSAEIGTKICVSVLLFSILATIICCSLYIQQKNSIYKILKVFLRRCGPITLILISILLVEDYNENLKIADNISKNRISILYCKESNLFYLSIVLTILLIVCFFDICIGVYTSYKCKNCKERTNRSTDSDDWVQKKIEEYNKREREERKNRLIALVKKSCIEKLDTYELKLKNMIESNGGIPSKDSVFSLKVEYKNACFECMRRFENRWSDGDPYLKKVNEALESPNLSGLRSNMSNSYFVSNGIPAGAAYAILFFAERNGEPIDNEDNITIVDALNQYQNDLLKKVENTLSYLDI